jgi:hypothetical protein
MTGLRRFLGYAALAAGGVATFVFLSPLFPIGVEAFLVGGVFFALGAWALAGPELRTILRRAARVKSGRLGTGREERPRVPIDQLLPVRILKLARERGGALSVSEVAISLNVPLDQAEEGLAACVRAGNATMDFNVSRGFTFYTFPEYLPPEDRTITQ